LDRDAFGNKNVAFNSGGGLVHEAFLIVDIMGREKVTIIVSPGAICASACAQIIFPAGVHRVIIDGGRLGMHSCSKQGNSDQLCNDVIAQNALNHGTEYGSVMAFMMEAGPNEMVWFSSKDADCWGLTRWPSDMNRGVQPGEIAPCVRQSIKRTFKEQAK
jgi:hypothetical protein